MICCFDLRSNLLLRGRMTWAHSSSSSLATVHCWAVLLSWSSVGNEFGHVGLVCAWCRNDSRLYPWIRQWKYCFRFSSKAERATGWTHWSMFSSRKSTTAMKQCVQLMDFFQPMFIQHESKLTIKQVKVPTANVSRFIHHPVSKQKQINVRGRLISLLSHISFVFYIQSAHSSSGYRILLLQFRFDQLSQFTRASRARFTRFPSGSSLLGDHHPTIRRQTWSRLRYRSFRCIEREHAR